MRQVLRVAVPIAAASAVGFSLHVLAADRLPAWVSSQMSGVEIKRPPYGPDVVVPAALSAIEYGVAFFAAYVLLRRAFPTWHPAVRALGLAALCLALGGNLLRMPLMQVVIGNPLYVTLVQHAGIWVPYLAASLVLAYTYEWLSRKPA